MLYEISLFPFLYLMAYRPLWVNKLKATHPCKEQQ